MMVKYFVLFLGFKKAKADQSYPGVYIDANVTKFSLSKG
jgi:hypothetical protein